eukprot:CAMPEP_0173393682 /NCGR_PEP_ID=MMETSP1356-20130122/22252_1 /TAXON_ID=77927 ORGANISM="Hemiselmis virescens, Strain PCC157" /NCGR_SAMPLE_ID=MMETSP1356 /ASSEMBLY_ACC=CAM_ASM_000847 /LENGTH=95 /DNA_ID=CAMNT_0014351739 /DNA_START=178 /DNA_END=465 /DNA_ORIENTATION=+
MLVEAMLISGLGFSALVTVSGLGYFDKAAESVGLQPEGSLDKWQNNNEFTGAQLFETEDMIEDIQTDIDDIMGNFSNSGDESGDEEAAEEAKKEE